MQCTSFKCFHIKFIVNLDDGQNEKLKSKYKEKQVYGGIKLSVAFVFVSIDLFSIR